jgi:hypothetical protein
MGRTRHRQCSICNHERRHGIEVALTYGMTYNDVARRFGCSPDAAARHARKHLTPQMRAAILYARKPSEIDLEALERSEAEGILTALIAHRARHQQYIDAALEHGDIARAINADRGVIANLELTAKLLGQLVQHHQVTHANILISADYLQLRGAIVRALRPFPEAARAVSAALADLETAAAEEIKAKRPLLLEAAPC